MRYKVCPIDKTIVNQALQNLILIFENSSDFKVERSDFNIILNGKLYGTVPFQKLFTIKRMR